MARKHLMAILIIQCFVCAVLCSLFSLAICSLQSPDSFELCDRISFFHFRLGFFCGHLPFRNFSFRYEEKEKEMKYSLYCMAKQIAYLQYIAIQCRIDCRWYNLFYNLENRDMICISPMCECMKDIWCCYIYDTRTHAHKRQCTL